MGSFMASYCSSEAGRQQRIAGEPAAAISADALLAREKPRLVNKPIAQRAARPNADNLSMRVVWHAVVFVGMLA
jgi:hypothetical protein